MIFSTMKDEGRRLSCSLFGHLERIFTTWDEVYKVPGADGMGNLEFFFFWGFPFGGNDAYSELVFGGSWIALCPFATLPTSVSEGDGGRLLLYSTLHERCDELMHSSLHTTHYTFSLLD